MTFQESIAEISAPELVRILGCPRATAYQWKDGRRQPPAWLQPILLSVIARGTRKRHNKASLATDTSREAGRKKWKS
ncbi:MAG: hypothetical protein RL088_1027 [Verrucomicrobiota bacterium]|jgi:DNA-binding transcriptional regulator YiaG